MHYCALSLQFLKKVLLKIIPKRETPLNQCSYFVLLFILTNTLILLSIQAISIDKSKTLSAGVAADKVFNAQNNPIHRKVRFFFFFFFKDFFVFFLYALL